MSSLISSYKTIVNELLDSGFLINNINTWPIWFIVTFSLVIFFGLEVLSHIVPILFDSWPKIPIKGKHLDELEFNDILYIGINKILTVVFVYHLIQIVFITNVISWKLEDITIFNTLGALIGYYVLYDLFYATFHRILHFRSIYPYIHKHHHRQKAPSRGSLDAMNVHPIEFIVGEYIHLISIYFIPSHILTVVFFIISDGILASLNHTRADVDLFNIYSVRVHDVHHRMPESNYGQYTMLWDRLYGSYRPYNSVMDVKAD